MKNILKIILLISICLTTQTVQAKIPIDITYENGVYHVILKGDKIKKRMMFVSSEALLTNKEAHNKFNSYLTVNAGFFDPKNQKSVSYILTDRQTVEDPIFNENLMSDKEIRGNLDKILNRSEFRIIECISGKTSYRYEIVPHKTSVDFSCTIISSAQGGPLVYPELKLEEEFFILKDDEGNIIRESASVLQKAPRTIIGLKDGQAHILIITEENPMTMQEVHELCGKLGLDRAMAFDGGASTSMNYLNKYNITSIPDSTSGRSVKSFLIIPKKKPRL